MNKQSISCCLLIVSCLLFLSACNGNKEEDGTTRISPDVVYNPATADENSGNDTDAVPQFTFESDNHEFGEIKQGEVVSYAFKFKNTGKAPLVISSANASCGCTIPEFTKTPVEPGDEGFINVTFNSEGKSGMVSKTVTLIANTVPNSKVLTISAEINAPKVKD